MPRLPLYQVDAFAERPFTGNPAAVVPLDSWLPDGLMQAIALENNLSETAFLVPEGDGLWGLRWFTPEVEVDLCGHATLASAFVLSTILHPGLERMRFRTVKAGELGVTRDGDVFTLDFPSRPPQPVEVPASLVPALGGPAPQAVLASRDYFVVYETADQVRALAPNFFDLAGVDRMVIVTAPGGGPDGDVDFVSRFFAPKEGIPEDPVTGSAHCTLIPYWAEKLGKTRLEARQVSARSGRLHCALEGDRVKIGGRGVLYLEGSIHV
ncbi:PhzF family phenazine biosynthesis protein [Aerophototrophica crusticola]|uniref:PhzF family phenazine biosynthesis protein n=1 Tax=Aerophototrophica crusticola TaxID=1709002 RepID=A0A858R8U4_9PROT|nr:PhzF family phenazine biosynthesis protein [Rhodospirillaceae bacterium B3]